MIRLDNRELENIREIFRIHFLHTDKLWLFGSRVNQDKKGGDIDLYIETTYIDLATVAEKKIGFLVDLKEKIGDQKIDIVINVLSENKQLLIYDEAKLTGVRLV